MRGEKSRKGNSALLFFGGGDRHPCLEAYKINRPNAPRVSYPIATGTLLFLELSSSMDFFPSSLIR